MSDRRRPSSDREELIFATGLALGILVGSVGFVKMTWWLVGAAFVSIWFYWLIDAELGQDEESE